MPTAAARAREAKNPFFSQSLAEADPEVVRHDRPRARSASSTEIELIASENIVSRAVLEAAGSVMTNKYAEGYPGKRYYGGCQFVDEVETLAIERAKKLFGCNFANVQPNSGSQMNQAVFLALLQPGDTFMGLDLNAGGHLTHGSPVNMSGKWFKVVPYGVRSDDQLIDMDEVARDRARAQAEADHRRRHRLFALLGLGAVPRDRRRGRRLPDGRHGAHRRARRRRRASLAGPARACRHDDDAQVAARPARRHDPDATTRRSPRRSTRRCFPGLQGGPLMHIIAAKAVAFGEALRPEFKVYAQGRRRQRQGCWPRRSRPAATTSSRAAPTTI